MKSEIVKNPDDKSCDPKKVETCFQELVMVIDPKFKAPKNVNEVNQLCQRHKENNKCVKDYAAKCLDKLAKQALSIAMFGISKTNKGYCSNTKKKNAFMSLLQCAEKDLRSFHKSFNQYTKDLLAIKEYEKDEKLHLPMACCAIHRMADGIRESIKCSDADSREVDALLNGYLGDAINFVCGDYDQDSDKCDSVYKKIKPWKKELPWKVFIIPLVNVLV